MFAFLKHLSALKTPCNPPSSPFRKREGGFFKVCSKRLNTMLSLIERIKMNYPELLVLVLFLASVGLVEAFYRLTSNSRGR
jgi:hypothetical protein